MQKTEITEALTLLFKTSANLISIDDFLSEVRKVTYLIGSESSLRNENELETSKRDMAKVTEQNVN